MESEFYTTAEVAAKLGMTYDSFRQAIYKGRLQLPFNSVRISSAKGKNIKLKWRKIDVHKFISELGNLEQGQGIDN